jgi:hypothetical protein
MLTYILELVQFHFEFRSVLPLIETIFISGAECFEIASGFRLFR